MKKTSIKSSVVDGELNLELHKTDATLLAKARDIGALLHKMHQEEGNPLCDAVDAVLKKFGPVVADGEEAESGGES